MTILLNFFTFIDHKCRIIQIDSFEFHFFITYLQKCEPASMAQLDERPTGDQEVTDSTPAVSAIFFHRDLIMKYLLQSFSPFL